MRTIVPTQEVWFVSGCEEGYLFETKLDAEIYARKIFPDMSEDNRYARVKNIWRVVDETKTSLFVMQKVVKSSMEFSE
jgi:hypothetical protein